MPFFYYLGTPDKFASIVWYPFHGIRLEGYGCIDWLTQKNTGLFLEMSKAISQHPLKDGQSDIVTPVKSSNSPFDVCVTRDERTLPLDLLVHKSLEHIIQNRYKYICVQPPRMRAGIQRAEEEANTVSLLAAVRRILELYPRVTIYLAVQAAPVTARVLDDHKIPDIGMWSPEHSTFLMR